METKSQKYVAGLGLLCSLIAVIFVFLTWATLDGVSYSGWAVYSDELFADVSYNYGGLVVVVCGILALIFQAVTAYTDKRKTNEALDVLTIILTLVSVIIVGLEFGGIGDIAEVGYGLWVSLAFMVLSFLLAICDCYMQYSMTKKGEA